MRLCSLFLFGSPCGSARWTIDPTIIIRTRHSPSLPTSTAQQNVIWSRCHPTTGFSQSLVCLLTDRRNSRIVSCCPCNVILIIPRTTLAIMSWAYNAVCVCNARSMGRLANCELENDDRNFQQQRSMLRFFAFLLPFGCVHRRPLEQERHSAPRDIPHGQQPLFLLDVSDIWFLYGT